MVPSLAKQVIDHMARLDFEVDCKQGGTLISMHCSYLDYLEDNNLVERQVEQKKVDNNFKASIQEGDDDLEGLEEPSDLNPGRFRFDNVIKSMVARLEMYNGLAPLQEYGRHLTNKQDD